MLIKSSVELHTVVAGAHTRAKFATVAVYRHNVNFKVDSKAEMTVVLSSFLGVPEKPSPTRTRAHGPQKSPPESTDHVPCNAAMEGQSDRTGHSHHAILVAAEWS